MDALIAVECTVANGILYVLSIYLSIYICMLYYNKNLKKKYWIEFCKQWEALKFLVNGRIRPSGTFVFVFFFLNVIFGIKLLIFFFNFVLLLTSYVWDHFCCHHIGRWVFSLCNFMRKLTWLMDASFSWRMYSWQWNWDSNQWARAGTPYLKDFLANPKTFWFACVLPGSLSWIKHWGLMLKVISLELMKNVRPALRFESSFVHSIDVVFFYILWRTYSHCVLRGND